MRWVEVLVEEMAAEEESRRRRRNSAEKRGRNSRWLPLSPTRR
jgi:hypothetical protein